MHGRILYLGGIAVAAAFLGAFAYHEGRYLGTGSVWREIAWPFPRDAWPPGRAFRCVAAVCNEGAEMYVRPKIGFCNCATGVDSDDELDRVTDLDLISESFLPASAGEEISFGGMPGRARNYKIKMPDGTERAATGFAVARGCDVVVSVIQDRGSATAPVRSAALEQLSSNTVAVWLSTKIGS